MQTGNVDRKSDSSAISSHINSHLMQSYRSILLAMAAMLSVLSLSGATFSWSGVIVSTEDNQPVELALVKLNTQQWAVADVDGNFKIPA